MGSEMSKMSEKEGGEGEIKGAQSAATKKLKLINEEHDKVSENTTQKNAKTAAKDEKDVLRAEKLENATETPQRSKLAADAGAAFSDISETELSDGEEVVKSAEVEKVPVKMADTTRTPPPTDMGDTSDISETELTDGEGAEQPAIVEKAVEKIGDTKMLPPPAKIGDTSDVSETEFSEGEELVATKESEKQKDGLLDISCDELSEQDKSGTSASLETAQVETAELSTGVAVVDVIDATIAKELDSMEVATTDETSIGSAAVPDDDASVFAEKGAEMGAEASTVPKETTKQENSTPDADQASMDEDSDAVLSGVVSQVPENTEALITDISDLDDNPISVAKDELDGTATAETAIASSVLTEKDKLALDDAIITDVDSSDAVEAKETSPVQETLLEQSANIMETEEADNSAEKNEESTEEKPSITEKHGQEEDSADVQVIEASAVDGKAQDTILIDDEEGPEENLAEPITKKQKITADGTPEITEKDKKAEEPAVESSTGKAAEDEEAEKEIVLTAVKPAEEGKKVTEGAISTAVKSKAEIEGDEEEKNSAEKLSAAEKPDEENATVDLDIIKEAVIVSNEAPETISVQEDESCDAKLEESTEEKQQGKADGEPKHIEEEAKPDEEHKDVETTLAEAAKPVSAVDMLIAEVLAPEDEESSAPSVEKMEIDDVSFPIVNEANESQESISSNLVIDEKFDTTDTTEPNNSTSEELSTADASKERAFKESEKAEESVASAAPPTKVIEIEDEAMEVETAKPADDSVMIIEIDDDDDEVPVKTTDNAETSESLLVPTKSQKGAGEIDVEDAIKSATVATTSSGAEVATADSEVYYNKTCINYNCPQQHKQFYRAPRFALSHFKINKKNFKPQFICSTCWDDALEAYEFMCGTLQAKQPLFLAEHTEQSQEAVNIIVSSDEENEDDDVQTSKPALFDKEELDLIQQELTRSMKKVFDEVDIQHQLTWTKALLTARLKSVEEEHLAMDEEINGFKSKLDKMYNSLYQYPKMRVQQQQAIDGNTGQPYYTEDSDAPQIPPFGEVVRPPIQPNENYYAVKNKAIASWVPCKVLEQIDNVMGGQKNLKHYKIKYLKATYQMVKTVSNKHIAYFRPPNVRLNTGERVIAYFDANSISPNNQKVLVQSAFYPGIIAEPLRESNRYRYLIFYDDGYTQYVQHKDVRLVCNVSDKVWEDVHVGSREFIESYLTQHTINRPMVQTSKGQNMSAESNGKWTYARVVDIDCSLIQMQFDTVKSVPHTEWIYRGSMRLGPVFHEHRKRIMQAETTNTVVSRNHRRHEPYVRYAEDEESKKSATSQEGRAVAKKSMGRPPNALPAAPTNSLGAAKESQSAPTTVRHLNNSTIYVDDDAKPKGKVVYYTTKHPKVPRKYVPHKCGPGCLNYDKKDLRAYSPFSKPILLGWERMLTKQKIKKFVTYRGPCGKIMRNMKELRLYLRQTDNILNVDQFDFSPDINCLAEYTIESQMVFVRDISYGQEKVLIPLVNYYDMSMPPPCKYAAQRIPTEGVPLNLDTEFLVGCDCDDDCSDKSKCACWQLTLAGARYGNPNTPTDEIGYQYKRLHEHVPTGIYECNSRCKCKSNCLNRVVQHSLEMRLQVFKTSNRGWGLRCLNDIPKGSFICIYAGHLLTEAKANEGGLDAGDEYFAELDYIEVAEQIKEGYESEVETDVEPEEEEEESFSQEQDDDDEFTPSKSFMTRSKSHRSRNARLSLNDEDSQERQVINFNPNSDLKETSGRDSSMRSLFGKDEACYVMDAKVMGNLGRYFNHSCTPNLFVQNVFVDTHDLRFPWVAFFSSMNIRAGTELTWNYNYEVGVVPGKVLYCQCGTPNCRGRLL